MMYDSVSMTRIREIANFDLFVLIARLKHYDGEDLLGLTVCFELVQGCQGRFDVVEL